MVGMLGGGQLGRMSLLAGRRLGYRFHVYDPAKSRAAGPLADANTVADFGDEAALAAFAASVDVATLEFENIPEASLDRLVSMGLSVRPAPSAVIICQHRAREKAFLREHGFPHVAFRLVDSAKALGEATAALGFPCVVKTAAFGYDGKGQRRLDAPLADPSELWLELGGMPLVVEAWCPFHAECSMMVARDTRGTQQCYALTENHHHRHILHQSIVPARLPEAIHRQAQELALDLVDALDFTGVLAVELFVTDDGLLINELAPRPHNSGHHTIESSVTSQFEQHIRAVVGLPLGAPHLREPAVMTNLLGDLWPKGAEPDWAGLLRAHPRLKLHLYGKGQARPGRKMGHFTLTGTNQADLLHQADAALRFLESRTSEPTPRGWRP